MNRALNAPRVLVLGSVLGQAMGGVRRHNAEVLPRVAQILAARGGSLAVAVGRGGLGFGLPSTVELLSTNIPAQGPLRRARSEGRWTRRLAAEARAAGRPFDLVHSAHQPLSRNLGLPHSLLVHDLRNLSAAHAILPRRIYARRALDRALAGATCVQAVSAAVKTELVETFGLDKESVWVVGNGADHMPVLPRRAGAGARLLVLGHIEPRKGLAVVIEALADDPSLPDVLFAGRAVGEEQERLEALAHSLQVTERVEFAGAADEGDLPRLFAEAACVVCPSELEGFGIVAVEAARAGAPLAVSRIAPHEEVASIATPRFEVGDASACARAIHEAQQAPTGALEQAQKNAGRFAWGSVADALVTSWIEGLGR